jgi:glycosyltransferase involved in cell wall biosynthesis
VEVHPGRVFAIVPAYQEAQALPATVRDVLALGYSVVVVDDGSRDDTEEALLGLPIHYLKHAANLGQGAALQTGMDYAVSQGAEILIHFDADGQHPANRIPDLIRPITAGECDVVLGSRFLRREDRALVPWKKRLALRVGIVVSGILTGVWLSDTHNGFRALSRQAAMRIRLRENGFAHATEILACLRSTGLRYREAPVGIRYTAYSIRKGQPVSNGLNVVMDLLLSRVLR